MNYWLIFLTGLTTGGLSCLAMQGGLLASVITNQKEILSQNNQKPHVKDWQLVAMFLVAKLITHTIFGLLLGSLGSVISLSLEVRLFFQIFTAVFMFSTAMNLLNVHPFFRKFAIQPPKFIYKYIKNATLAQTFFAPVLLGVLTIFVPCGVTQAMEIQAINTGSAIAGALTLAFFVLGTSPLFFTVGFATAKLSDSLKQTFYKVAAIILIGMSLYGINGVLTALDSPFSFNRITQIFNNNESTNQPTIQPGETQNITVNITNSGYSPKSFTVKAGSPVVLTLTTNGVYSCASAFVFREFGINTTLKSTDTQSFKFTPNKKGTYNFSCSMGMYTGTMRVE